MNNELSNSETCKRYVSNCVDIISKSHPEWDKHKIEQIVWSDMKDQLKIPNVVMDNNYTHETHEASLLSVLDWIKDRKPIIAGNGTFYKRHDEAINPIAKMLDDMLINRKNYKKKMFAYPESAPEYRNFDLLQSNEKTNCNSYYGGSGMPASAFYSQWSGPATTLTAQSVICTCETTFEGLFPDNCGFLSLEDCFDWIHSALANRYDIDPFVIKSVNIDARILYDRLVSLFKDFSYDYCNILHNYIKSLSRDEMIILYYKNNFMQFTRDFDKIQKLYDTIFRKVRIIDTVSSVDDIPAELLSEFKRDNSKYNDASIVKDYNKWALEKAFLNPYNIPSEIKDELKELIGYYMKYCYNKHLVSDRIYRLKSLKRKMVVTVDTDSNMLYCGFLNRFIHDDILHGEDYNRDMNMNMFISVNIIANIATESVTDVLLYYGEKSNIEEKIRPRFNMKNEFLFRKMILMKKKKRYISSVILREGNLFNPVKVDLKGVDFLKSESSAYATTYFKKLCTKYLLESDEIDVRALYDELKHLEGEIYDSIKSGKKQFLPNASAKDMAAYKNPWGVQSVKAVYAWDVTNPSNQIDLPCKMNFVKLKVFSAKDLDPLKETDPHIYKLIIKNIFESPDSRISSAGFKIMAIPNNVPEIPEWIIPFIDYDSMISDILCKFKCVLDTLNMSHVECGKTTTRKFRKFTNIVQF